MKICIVITTYNRLTLLKECINNILSFRSQVETIMLLTIIVQMALKNT